MKRSKMKTKNTIYESIGILSFHPLPVINKYLTSITRPTESFIRFYFPY